MELLIVQAYEFDHSVNHGLTSRGRKPHEDDSGSIRRTGMDELSEVLVFRQQQPRLPESDSDNFFVFRAWRGFTYREHIVSRASQRADDRRVAALVRQKAHLSTRGLFRRVDQDRFLVGE